MGATLSTSVQLLSTAVTHCLVEKLNGQQVRGTIKLGIADVWRT